MEFEWDDSKAESNFKKHGIKFSEAVTIWLDDSSVEMPDLEYSSQEERWIRLGMSRKANLLVVAYCEKTEDSRIRVISARSATKHESKQYNSR